MSEKRVIKKYPNRRLYDTVESKYITLEDVRQLIVDGVDFCVSDQKTGEDITRSILLQIILELEDRGNPIFTTDMLSRIICFYGDTMQNLVTEFLGRSISLFTEQQRLVQDRFNSAVKHNPLTAVAELTQRNIELWTSMQNSFFTAAGLGNAKETATATEQEKAQKSSPREGKDKSAMR